MVKTVVSRWTDRIVSRLLADRAIDSAEAEAYQFGVEIMFLKAIHFFSYTLIAAAMKKIPEFLVIFCVLSIFRKNTGGFHAKTRIGCYFFSCGVIVAGLFFSEGFVFIRPWQMHCLMAACLILMWMLAPVENRNRRLDDSEIYYFRRRLIWSSIIFFLLYLITWATIEDESLSNLIAVGIGLNTVLTVMGKRRMKGIRILFCCVGLSLIFSKTAYAEEIVSEKEPIDIIFVIDCSGSMKTNDSSKMGLNMVQAFVDTVQAADIRVGYVAYNDSILSFSAPESIALAEKRESLKEEIGEITYWGDTDIGLGVSYAYGLLSEESGTRKMMVLISDGETDLPKGNERTEEQSNQELEQCVLQCKEENIQIYTVAFGQYDGSKAVLEEVAAKTGAASYSAQGPEDLIEVLYGIFQDNLVYKIQQFSSGTYAGGSQEIKCVLDAPYLDEINILLLSSESVGEAAVRYGGEEIPLTGLSHYAVGKIENAGTDAAGKELVIRAETGAGQDMQVYVISYRELVPVLQIASSTGKNQELEYQVYFRNRDGSIIQDAGFYETFSWEFVCDGENMVQENVGVSDGVLKGKISFSHSGAYVLCGMLSDDFGSFPFSARVEVTNAMPTGSIPENSRTLLEGEYTLCLDDYFADQDNDTLLYTITDASEGVNIRLEGSLLTIDPQNVGTHMVALLVSDGENAIQYVYHIKVIPLWQAYWWIFVFLFAVAAFLLWKIFHKPKPELERLTEEKKQNHFCGKLDAYFVLQPEEEEEIPPLSFQMNKVKDGRVSLGDLFGAYPEQAKVLQLEDIFLIADENRNMILYHRSKSGVMVGNAIACMQIQYSISFDDIIYITSPKGDYDLEIHYVAVFQ